MALPDELTGSSTSQFYHSLCLPGIIATVGDSTALLFFIYLFFSGRTEKAQGRGSGGLGASSTPQLQRELEQKKQWLSCVDSPGEAEAWQEVAADPWGCSWFLIARNPPPPIRCSFYHTSPVSSSSCAFLGKEFLTPWMLGFFLCTGKG